MNIPKVIKFGDSMLGFGIKHFEVLEKNLIENEEAQICFIGILTQGKEDHGNYACALTNKRFILAQKKTLAGNNVKFINLNNLNDIFQENGILSERIVLTTTSDTFVIKLGSIAMEKLYPLLNKAFADFKNTNNPNNQSNQNNDVTNELRNFKSLLDDGVISLEEFEAKKKQLLNL